MKEVEYTIGLRTGEAKVILQKAETIAEAVELYGEEFCIRAVWEWHRLQLAVEMRKAERAYYKPTGEPT